MKIMITGAQGRLGRVVTRTAADLGHQVLACDRVAPDGVVDLGGPVETVRLDVADFDAVRDAISGIDAVVHCAAITQPLDHPWHQVHSQNVIGSYNVLLAAALEGVERVTAMSSVNAVGGVFSRSPRFDYFPVDTAHPSYAEDPYSLSKLILEEQARSVARRFPQTAIACLRLHALQDREPRLAAVRSRPDRAAADLWGYTPIEDAARLCLTVIDSDLSGAEVFYAVARQTASEVPSEELHRRYFPQVPLRRPLRGHDSFYDSSVAAERFGWDA
ncbi:NAD(P)-dependent oxidoreductase [Microlunatus elymi]|uniref:NAD(P)-dependent oxidoreductase n=1 Tax=Microlunatus elymi TaxID=2596828 RepID=A0A516PVL7_9ACTN|nr:NAD(P)-dependent oxidoreductase [Microlunatus elymi]QDP95227.1 NAD(P)-dependent oxidoreductase [Microlunatus elymi]